MPEDFNELELAILTWFRMHYKNERLSAQIESAKFLNREWTKVGFFVKLKISTELPPIDLRDFNDHWPIDGPNIQSADIEHGGGSILWGKEGYIDQIEIYAFGGYFNEKVNEFSLSV